MMNVDFLPVQVLCMWYSVREILPPSLRNVWSNSIKLHPAVFQGPRLWPSSVHQFWRILGVNRLNILCCAKNFAKYTHIKQAQTIKLAKN